MKDANPFYIIQAIRKSADYNDLLDLFKDIDEEELFLGVNALNLEFDALKKVLVKSIKFTPKFHKDDFLTDDNSEKIISGLIEEISLIKNLINTLNITKTNETVNANNSVLILKNINKKDINNTDITLFTSLFEEVEIEGDGITINNDLEITLLPGQYDISGNINFITDDQDPSKYSQMILKFIEIKNDIELENTIIPDFYSTVMTGVAKQNNSIIRFNEKLIITYPTKIKIMYHRNSGTNKPIYLTESLNFIRIQTNQLF